MASTVFYGTYVWQKTCVVGKSCGKADKRDVVVESPISIVSFRSSFYCDDDDDDAKTVCFLIDAASDFGCRLHHLNPHPKCVVDMTIDAPLDLCKVSERD